MIHGKEIDLSLPYHSLYGLNMRFPFSLKVLAYSLFFDGSFFQRSSESNLRSFSSFCQLNIMHFPWLHCFGFLGFLCFTLLVDLTGSCMKFEPHFRSLEVHDASQENIKPFRVSFCQFNDFWTGLNTLPVAKKELYVGVIITAKDQ